MINRIKSGFAFIAPLLLLCPGSPLSARARRHERADASSAATALTHCYVPGDSTEIRLWEGRAPGAAGDDSCRDVPFIRMFPASAGPSATPAILIIAGGGYDRLTDAKEQAPVAEYLSQTLHVTAFVLYYRLAQPDGTYRYPVPMWDGQRALKLIRARASGLDVDSQRVALLGFSAGGHLASMLALHSATDFGLPVHDAVDAESGRPNLLALGYPVISMDPGSIPPSGSYRNLLRGYQGPELKHLQTYLSGEENVTLHTPPVFLFESMDDAIISPQNSVMFVAAIKAKSIPVEAHLFTHGEHGAGLAVGIPEESAWPEMFQQWLVSQSFIAR